MPVCHHFSRAWLLTDARLADHGVAAARYVPPGSVIVLRSDDLAPAVRRKLLCKLRRIAKARRCLFLIAGARPEAARRVRADGVHLRGRSRTRAAQARRLGLMVSMPVHDRREAAAAAHAGADFALVSPLYATRSHAGVTPLTMRMWLALARRTKARPVALGGMTAARQRAVRLRTSASGIMPDWAAIDAWERQR